ncbi:MAG: hypothetical protein HYT03_02040 [Candidatus Harrisonbacteria bacterium]|nr:hypothetical protein [Candidatus Harrisonbacteria bacterium]
MAKSRIDPHEETVVNALTYAFSKDVPNHFRVKLGEKFFHTVPGGKVNLDLDPKGVDVLIILKSGLAIPFQIKAGKQTLGLALPIPEVQPDRIEGRFYRSMRHKVNRHLKLHPEVKAILFVKDGAAYQDIIREINIVIEILIRHLICDFKKLCADL